MDEDELTCIGDKMTSSSIKIKNGTVVSSECQGLCCLRIVYIQPYEY